MPTRRPAQANAPTIRAATNVFPTAVSVPTMNRPAQAVRRARSDLLCAESTESWLAPNWVIMLHASKQPLETLAGNCNAKLGLTRVARCEEFAALVRALT